MNRLIALAGLALAMICQPAVAQVHADAYAAELRDWPHPRSRQGVEHLARWRGATVGMEAAEAFMLGRRLE